MSEWTIETGIDQTGVEDGRADGYVSGMVTCRAKHESGFTCTRPAGHRGDHAAWGLGATLGARWAS